MKNTPSPIISAVVAMAENRVIGINNQLPWHLPADLKHFKTLTNAHPILMGRKTFESIGRPLPNRTNIILTRNASYSAPNCVIVTTIEEAIAYALSINSSEIFIIGGAHVYEQFMSQIERIYLTIVHHAFDGDAFFPELDKTQWKEVNRETHSSDEANAYSYSFLTLDRIT